MTQTPVRLFVALELAARSRTELARWAAHLAGPELRPVGADALHMTLCFLGDVAAEDVPALSAALAAVAPSGVAASHAVAGARWLPSRRPRVLAVELADPGGDLNALQSAVARALVSGGWYEPGGRRYLPHVTVARVRAPGGRTRLTPPALAVRPEAVSLVRSRLGRGPARYERLAIWPIR